MQQQARDFYQLMSKRRSVRDFSINLFLPLCSKMPFWRRALRPAAPICSPGTLWWCRMQRLRQKIREAAEIEERELYENRASEEWLDALAPLGTDANKPFLETAPASDCYLPQERSLLMKMATKHKNYYTSESVGIATGRVNYALHNAGLATLTHTPSPMKFLSQILERPSHERPFLLLVTGYPAEGHLVPDIKRLPLDKIATFL